MPGVVGNVIIGFSANLAGLTKGVKAAQGTIGGFVKSIGSALGGIPIVGGLLGAAGIGSAVAGLKSMHDAASENIDSLGKLAERIGATTEGLAGLVHAAGLSDVSQEQLGAALTKLGVNLANAVGGSKELEKAFEDLKLDPKQLATLDRVEAFKRLTDAINKLPTPAARAAAAVKTLGKAGANLGNLMAGGSAAIDAATKEAERLNKTFSAVDKKKVEEANDAWTTFGAAVEGLGNKMAISLAETSKGIAEFLTNLTVAFSSKTDQIFKNSFAFAIFRGGGGFADPASAGLKKVADAASGIAPAFAAADDEALELTQSIEKLSKKFTAELTGGGLSSRMRQIADIGAPAKDTAGLKALAAQLDRFDKVRDVLKMMRGDAERLAEATRTPAETLAFEQDKINKLLRAGLIDVVTGARALAKAREDAGIGLGPSSQLSGAFEQGSAEARSAILASRAAVQEEKAKTDRVAEAAEELVTVEKDVFGVLNDILRAMGGGGAGLGGAGLGAIGP